jgi:hypothetical protein
VQKRYFVRLLVVWLEGGKISLCGEYAALFRLDSFLASSRFYLSGFFYYYKGCSKTEPPAKTASGFLW